MESLLWTRENCRGPYTWAYQRSIQSRCKCCGEFLSSIDALEAAARAGMPSATELCTDCQFKLSVVLAELGREGRRA